GRVPRIARSHRPVDGPGVAGGRTAGIPRRRQRLSRASGAPRLADPQKRDAALRPVPRLGAGGVDRAAGSRSARCRRGGSAGTVPGHRNPDPRGPRGADRSRDAAAAGDHGAGDMTALPFFQVDAFAERPLTGNPAAVMPLEKWLVDEIMQAIAAENNLSETAFTVASEDGAADYELRWFTPKLEVELCGHATLASG